MSKKRMIEEQIKVVERQVIEKLLKKRQNRNEGWQQQLRTDEDNNRKDLVNITKKY